MGDRIVWACAACGTADCVYESSEDCSAHTNTQLRKELEDLRARGVVLDTECTCGSGGHPRRCAKHPHRFEMHCHEIDQENAFDAAKERLGQLESECAEARKLATMHEASSDEYKESFVHWKGRATEAESRIHKTREFILGVSKWGQVEVRTSKLLALLAGKEEKKV